MSDPLRKAAAAAVIVAGLVLAGCSASTVPSETTAASASSAVNPATTAASTLTATSTPTPTVDADDPSTWLVTDDGIGPLLLGADFAATVAVMPGGTRVDDGCSWAAFWTSEDGEGLLVAARDSADPAGAVREVAWVANTPSETTSVAGPRTADGIGLGSPWSEVVQTHPSASPVGLVNQGTGIQVGRVWFTSLDEQAVDGLIVTAGKPASEYCG